MSNKRKLIFWIFFLLLTVISIISVSLSYTLGASLGQSNQKTLLMITLVIMILFLVLGSIFAIGSSLTRETILNNYQRARIFTTIEQKPGIHFNELTRNLGLSNGQASWHITCLKNFDMIRVVKVKNYTTFYSNYNCFFGDIEPIQLVALKNETRNKIYQAICNNPKINQNQLIQLIQVSQSTIAYHLIILEQEKLIAIKKKGRIRYYYSMKDSK